MDFAFSKEHQMFRRMVHEFAEQEVRPLAKKHDRQESLEPELIRKSATRGCWECLSRRSTGVRAWVRLVTASLWKKWAGSTPARPP